jgi:hypothetical protein
VRILSFDLLRSFATGHRILLSQTAVLRCCELVPANLMPFLYSRRDRPTIIFPVRLKRFGGMHWWIDFLGIDRSRMNDYATVRPADALGLHFSHTLQDERHAIA